MTRQPHGPVGRGYLSSVNTTLPDPRLLGRTVRRIVYTKEQIAARVRELGDEITSFYPEGELLVLGLLKGSFIFLSDLVREIGRPLQVDFPRGVELRRRQRRRAATFDCCTIRKPSSKESTSCWSKTSSTRVER